MKPAILLLCAVLLLGQSATAQDIAGDWSGMLALDGDESLPLVFHIVKEGDGYRTTMDSPNQGATGLATDATAFQNDTLTITMSAIRMTYRGRYDAGSNRIDGTFMQGPASLPLLLKRGTGNTRATLPARRPQDPDPAGIPYRQEEVIFPNPKGGNVLAGTLTLPATGAPKKMVVLISGSGPQNRDEEIRQFNHRPFLVWADYLTRQGIGVLRYDDRGVGKSTGSTATATTADFADDAGAAVQFLQSRKDLAGAQIGLMGHSEGGMIAPMVAARNKAVAFVVMLAGPGVPIRQLMLHQMDDQARLSGVPAALARLNHDAGAAMFDYMSKHPSTDTAAFRAGLLTILKASLAKYPDSVLGGATIDAVAAEQVQPYLYPWYRYFIAFDPSVYLREMQCPVLAINGTLDMQVSADENLAGIRKALAAGGNRHATVQPMPGLNHLLQAATTGGVEEYGAIEETVNAAALKVVGDWVLELR